MKKTIGIFCFLILNLAKAQTIEKGTIQFTHIPVIVLKYNPTSLFGVNNSFDFGVELAPPVGKFSYEFGYGFGKSSWNFNKDIKNNFGDSKHTQLRGEIRAYFSDWYPFYALDKKPFGRYYALEFVQGNYDRDVRLANGQGGKELADFTKFEQSKFKESEQRLNIKFGKNILLKRYLFLDVFIGIGIGKYKTKEITNFEDNIERIPFHFGFINANNIHLPNTKGYFFSKTAGIKLAFPI